MRHDSIKQLNKEPSQWVKAISTSGTLRGVAIQGTSLVREICGFHQNSPWGTERLGEAIISGLFLASFCKTGERMNLNIQTRGRIKQALVDAYPDGTVRGYLIESEMEPDPESPWFDGTLSVLRTREADSFKPYVGTVPIITGHIAKDVTFYWLQSEQIPSAMAVYVRVSKTGYVESAGGFLVQALPGAKASEVKLLEREVGSLKNFSEAFAEGQDPLGVLSGLLQNVSFHILERRNLSSSCTCSQDRVERALMLTGFSELDDTLKAQGMVEVVCDFCTKKYQFDREKIQNLFKKYNPLDP